MKCPNCGNDDTKVLDSRPIMMAWPFEEDGNVLNVIFGLATHEEMEILDLTVVKRDGRKEPYLREKIESGIRKAFEKRPLTREDFAAIMSGIEQDIQKLDKKEIWPKKSEI
jgi:transcriptional repressor NrdR